MLNTFKTLTDCNAILSSSRLSCWRARIAHADDLLSTLETIRERTRSKESRGVTGGWVYLEEKDKASKEDEVNGLKDEEVEIEMDPWNRNRGM